MTFTEDVMVNGTLLEAAEYQVRFDESSGELSIMRFGDVKAKMPARLEARTGKAKTTSVRTRLKNGVHEFIGITFNGWDQDVMVSSSGR